MVLEASCSTAYIPVLSLDMVETTRFLMDSTLMASIGGLMPILCSFLVICKGWTLLEVVHTLYTCISRLARNKTRFCSYFCGILVILCFCIVSSYVISYSYVLDVSKPFPFF